MSMERPPISPRTVRAVRREIAVADRPKEALPPKSMVEFHFDRLRDELREAFKAAEPDEEALYKKWNHFFAAESQSASHFGQLMDDLRRAIAKRVPDGKKRGVNLDDPAWQVRIEGWIRALKDDMGALDVPAEARPRVVHEAQAFIEATTATATAQAFLDEIDHFQAREAVALHAAKTREPAIGRLKAQLEKEFAFSPEDIAAIVRYKLPSDPERAYSKEELFEVIRIVWEDYGLQNQKTKLARFALANVLAARSGELFPSDSEAPSKDKAFELGSYLLDTAESLGRSAFLEYVRHEEAELKRLVSIELNRRLVDTILFQHAEFGGVAMKDEVRMAIVGRGKQAINELIDLLFDRLLPQLATVGTGLYALTRLHPLVGMVGVGSLPLFIAALEKEDQLKEDNRQQDHAARMGLVGKLHQVQAGLENVRMSASAGETAHEVNAVINKVDEIDRKTLWQRVKGRVTERLPRVAVDVVAAGVGYGLQKFGVIGGEDVFKQLEFLQNLRIPVEQLFRLYGSELQRVVKDIQALNQMLGNENELDTPGGKRERERVPFSTLRGMDITLENLWFKNVLQGATETIKQGEFVLLIGESGSGKSTILRHVTDLQRPEYGEVRIGDVPVTDIRKYGPDSLYASLGYSSAEPEVFPELSIRENVLMWSHNSAVTDEEIKTLLRRLGLSRFAEDIQKPLGQISSGETLRIGLARALIKQPKILLLDEPTGSLDVKNAGEAWKLFQEMHDADPAMTIMCVTHSESVIERFTKDDPATRRRVIQMEQFKAPKTEL